MIITFFQVLAVFFYLTKLPFASVVIVFSSIISIFLSLIRDKFIVKKYPERKYLIWMIALLAVMVFRLIFQFVAGSDFNQVDNDYLITVLLALLIFTSFAFNPSRNALLYGIVIAVIFTLIWGGAEFVFRFNSSSSRFSDPGNIFFQSDNRVPTAFYYNENDMLYFIMLFFPAVFFFFDRKIITFIVFFLTSLLAVVITSKAALIALFIYMVWYVSKYLKNGYGIFFIIFVGALLSISISASWNALALSDLFDKVIYRFSGLLAFIDGQGGDNSSIERFAIYTSVASFLSDNTYAIICGIGNFSHYESIFLRMYKLRIADFHNMYFEVITLYGIIVSFLFFFILYLLYREKRNIRWKGRKVFRLMIFTFLTVLAILPSSVLKYPSFYIFFLFFILVYEDSQSQYE